MCTMYIRNWGPYWGSVDDAIISWWTRSFNGCPHVHAGSSFFSFWISRLHNKTIQILITSQCQDTQINNPHANTHCFGHGKLNVVHAENWYRVSKRDKHICRRMYVLQILILLALIPLLTAHFHHLSRFLTKVRLFYSPISWGQWDPYSHWSVTDEEGIQALGSPWPLFCLEHYSSHVDTDRKCPLLCYPIKSSMCPH